MAGVEVEWIGLDAWISKVIDMRRATPEKVQTIMESIGKDAKEVMDAATPVGTRTTRDHRPGTLKAANSLAAIEGGFQLSNAAENGRGTVYSGFVNFGTRKMRAQPFFDDAVEFGAKAMDERLPGALDS